MSASVSNAHSPGRSCGILSVTVPAVLLLLVLTATLQISGVSDASDGASEGDDGNIHWEVKGDTLILSKKEDAKSGEMNDYTSTRPGWEDGDGWSGVFRVVIGEGVTTVGERAFDGCRNLIMLTIGDDVTEIGTDAFQECTSLVYTVVGERVTDIEDGSFANCYKMFEIVNLSALDIKKGETEYGDIAYDVRKEVLTDSDEATVRMMDGGFVCGKTVQGEGTEEEYFILAYVGSETSLILPDRVSTSNYVLFNNAFSGCTSITSVQIGDGPVMIEDYAFQNCTSLETVDIGKGTVTVKDEVFRGCGKLRSITVSDDNRIYSSKDGILFNKNMSTLLVYPMGKTDTSYVVPDTVETIGGKAFCGCSLKAVTIPGSVKRIGSDAFEKCESLGTVYYNVGHGISDIYWPEHDLLIIDANGGYVTGDPPGPERMFPSQDGFSAPRGLKFKGYNTESDGSGTSYSPGDRYDLSGVRVIYAQWNSSGDAIVMIAAVGAVMGLIAVIGGYMLLRRRSRGPSGDGPRPYSGRRTEGSGGLFHLPVRGSGNHIPLGPPHAHRSEPIGQPLFLYPGPDREPGVSSVRA